jgi:hypothetical protein
MLRFWCRFRVGVPGLPPHFLTFSFLSKLALKAFLFSRLHVEGVFLHILNNAFLLNLSLEAPKGAFNGLTFVHPNFGQVIPPRYVIAL